MNPQVDTPNKLIIDYADNPDLKEIFYSREPGSKIELTFHLQVMGKTLETVTLSIEKVVTNEAGPSGKDEAKATLKEPIMAVMNKRASDGKMGPHNRPPQQVENSAEPWLASYA